MKGLIHIILISLLFSGCATKTITNLAEGDKPRSLFSIDEVRGAYFKANSAEIVLDMAIRHKTPEKEERVCFLLDVEDVAKMPSYHRISLTTELQTACPAHDDLLNYQQIPVLRRHVLRKMAKGDITSDAPWLVEPRMHSVYIRSANNESTIVLKVMKSTPETQRAAYLLYPLTIIADLVTLPVQFISFLSTFSSEPAPRWPGWPGAR